MIAYYLALSAAMTGNKSYPMASSQYLELLRRPVVVLPASRGNPVPTGNPGLWVTTNDYPPEALREERELIKSRVAEMISQIDKLGI